MKDLKVFQNVWLIHSNSIVSLKCGLCSSFYWVSAPQSFLSSVDLLPPFTFCSLHPRVWVCKPTFFQVKGKGKVPSWSIYNSVNVNECSDHETGLGPVTLCHFKLQRHPQRRRVMNKHSHTTTSILPVFLSKTQKAKQTRLLSQIKIDCTAFYRWRCGGIMHYSYLRWIKDKLVFMKWHWNTQ